MDEGRIPNGPLYGEIATANRLVGRPNLRFKDSCKRDMKSFNIPSDKWETNLDVLPIWRAHLTKGVQFHDKMWQRDLREKLKKLKQNTETILRSLQISIVSHKQTNATQLTITGGSYFCFVLFLFIFALPYNLK